MSTAFPWALLFISALTILCAVRWVAYWLAEGKLVLEAGHLSPRPSVFSRVIRWLFGRAFVFLFVGPVRVIGAANLHYRGRIIALANHQIEADAILSIRYLLKLRHARYFIAGNQAVGVRAPLVAYTGGIVVDKTQKDGGSKALNAAMQAMEREQDASFVIFPQGRLVRDNKLERKDFFPGVVLLGKKTAATARGPVAYVPVGVYYDHDPAHASMFQRFVRRFIWRGFRKFFGQDLYGATIVAGDPIPVESLPVDVDRALDILFERVCWLTQAAEQIGRRG